MDATNNGVVDYSFALGVASSVMGLLISLLPWKLDDRVTRLLLLLANLAAVLYTAQSINGTLDLQHSAFAYLILAGIVPAGHYAWKLPPKEAPTAPVVAGAPESVQAAPQAPVSGVDNAAAQQVIQQALSGVSG